VEEAGGVDHRDLAAKRGEAAVSGVEHVADDKGGLQLGRVLEQFVANVDEFGFNVGADEAGALDAVRAELADDLADAAAEVKEDVLGVAEGEAEEDLLVARIGAVDEAEKLPAPDAGEPGDFPAVIALSTGKRRNILGGVGSGWYSRSAIDAGCSLREEYGCRSRGAPGSGSGPRGPRVRRTISGHRVNPSGGL
jgi:hypothetical protein